MLPLRRERICNPSRYYQGEIMKYNKIAVLIAVAIFLAGCGPAAETNTSRPAVNNANWAASPEKQTLSVAGVPEKIKGLMASRGDQDAAAPTLRIVEPRASATIPTSTVKVKLEISGDLKGYKPHMDHETKMGNHIHVILDDQPYEAYYNLDQEFELRNVADGEHTLRVFPSRPWHESYKNDGAFQMVKFTVKNGGADTAKPATTNSGAAMSNANTSATPEGKEMKVSTAGDVDPKRPLLTFSRPKGEYKGDDSNAIMIDFWLANAKLVGDGGEYRVRYTVNTDEPKFIDKWEPLWLSGWTAGKHTVKLELVDKDGTPIDNGGYNTSSREITVVK
jgi:hypothetical protein